ncbi:uncharacterized protein LOC128249292 [Octopus bimaculoides]|uniref:Uncharacterized protein n=1 Tax=Octopus bimaculoides TaxID=37653 RepID=A0A0L8FHF0_OCTBM|nr:uncharacterized protein LOC128249292 [Octopus bimaculoides]
MYAELQCQTQEERLQRELNITFYNLDKQQQVMLQGITCDQHKWRKKLLKYQLQIEINKFKHLFSDKSQETVRQMTSLSQSLTQKSEQDILLNLKKVGDNCDANQSKRLRRVLFSKYMNQVFNRSTGARSVNQTLQHRSSDGTTSCQQGNNALLQDATRLSSFGYSQGIDQSEIFSGKSVQLPKLVNTTGRENRSH